MYRRIKADSAAYATFKALTAEWEKTRMEVEMSNNSPKPDNSPNMRNFFGYIMVSTAKQGEHGVSLQKQRDAMERHAQRNDLKIASWFEERETAARLGRPVFNQMLKFLRYGKAHSVVIHKIDRSPGNRKDRTDLGERNEPLLTGLLVAASGTSPRLPRRTLADYGIAYGTYRRGTAGILRDLGTDVQGNTHARRCAPLRLAAHRALRPACETAAVGEEVFGTL